MIVIDGAVVDMIRVSSGVVVNTFDAHEEDSKGTYDEWEVGATLVQAVEFKGREDLFH